MAAQQAEEYDATRAQGARAHVAAAGTSVTRKAIEIQAAYDVAETICDPTLRAVVWAEIVAAAA